MLRKFSFYFSKQTGGSSLKRFLSKYDLEAAPKNLVPPPRQASEYKGNTGIEVNVSKTKAQISKNL
jgi:hypothetical protein